MVFQHNFFSRLKMLLDSKGVFSSHLVLNSRDYLHQISLEWNFQVITTVQDYSALLSCWDSGYHQLQSYMGQFVDFDWKCRIKIELQVRHVSYFHWRNCLGTSCLICYHRWYFEEPLMDHYPRLKRFLKVLWFCYQGVSRCNVSYCRLRNSLDWQRS